MTRNKSIEMIKVAFDAVTGTQVMAKIVIEPMQSNYPWYEPATALLKHPNTKNTTLP